MQTLHHFSTLGWKKASNRWNLVQKGIGISCIVLSLASVDMVKQMERKVWAKMKCVMMNFIQCE